MGSSSFFLTAIIKQYDPEKRDSVETEWLSVRPTIVYENGQTRISGVTAAASVSYVMSELARLAARGLPLAVTCDAMLNVPLAQCPDEFKEKYLSVCRALGQLGMSIEQYSGWQGVLLGFTRGILDPMAAAKIPLESQVARTFSRSKRRPLGIAHFG